jgi:carbamoyltransferase
MNGRLLRSGVFRQIYVQPAAHDAGNALGAALSVARELGDNLKLQPMAHVYFGSDIGTADEIEGQLARWSPLIAARGMQDTCRETAHLLADGAIVGWIQGRSEFGPRALGNRSILADPRPAQNKRLINEMVKKREAYRPFAPSVLQERLLDFFEVPETVLALPFMTFAIRVREDKHELLGAVTHVDRTARVQTIQQSENPRYYELIKKFGELTGVPILLNTSFNNDAEPIVESVDDAVATFLCTGLDHLVVGDWLVSKPAVPIEQAALLDLVPSIAEGRRLIIQNFENTGAAAFLEFLPGASLSRLRTPISHNLVGLLLDSERESSCADRCRRGGLDAAALRDELFSLWQARGIVLRPVTPTRYQ